MLETSCLPYLTVSSSVLTENEVCEVHVYGYQNIGMYSTMVKNNRDVYTMKQSSWWCSLIDTPWYDDAFP